MTDVRSRTIWVASEVRGRDLRVTNDEFERSIRRGECLRVLRHLRDERTRFREYESRTPIVGALRERESIGELTIKRTFMLIREFESSTRVVRTR